jgi:non-specific serine/threonine protein kinase
MADLEVGMEFAGHRLEAEVGRGGMGVVFRARDLALDRIVALKLIAPEFARDPDFRERFKRESKLAAAIRHSNVISIHRAGEEDGQLFITMDFVDGTDLKEMIGVRGRLDPAMVSDIVAQVASGLDAAHAKGLVHRDVKPANVLIEIRSGVRHAYLTDFGLTKKAAQSAAFTKTGMLVGTTDYLAPEQLEGRTIDARVDVYALGCVLYEALTGQVPYPRDTEAARMWAHVSEAPPSVLERAPQVSPAFDSIVRRAMAKDANERYVSAEDMGRDVLAAAAAGDAPRVAGDGAPTGGETVRSQPDPAAAAAAAAARKRKRVSRKGRSGAAKTSPGTTSSATPVPAETRMAEPAAEAPSQHGQPPQQPPPRQPPPQQPPRQPPPGQPYPQQPPPEPGGAYAPGGPGGAGGPPRTGSPRMGPAPARRGAGAKRWLFALVPALAAVVVVVLLAGGGGSKKATSSPAAALPVAPPPGQWRAVHPAPTARQQLSSAAGQGAIWLFGGLTKGTSTAKTEGYDPSIDTWKSGPDLPLPLHHEMAVTYKNEFVVLGGWIPAGAQLDATTSDRVFALRNGAWVPLPSLNHPRAAGAAAVVGSKLVVVGGRTKDQLVAPTEVFDGKGWKDAADIPVPRDHLAAASDGRYLYAVGGRKLTSDKNLGAFERYDPVANSWKKLPNMPTPRGGLGAAVVGRRLVAVGGEAPASVIGTVESFDLKKGTWSSLPSMRTPRHGLALAVVGKSLYALDGGTAPSHAQSTNLAEVLDFS